LCVSPRYHLRLHDKPDSFACEIDGCEKYFATPSSLRMHRLLDHGRPEEESTAEKQLRADAQAAADALDQVCISLSLSLYIYIYIHLFMYISTAEKQLRADAQAAADALDQACVCV